MLGERLSALASFAQCQLAAAAVLLSPYLPLLFMGEEYGEEAPFLYFTSHSDESLIEAVREGRKREFAAFEWAGQPLDPHDEMTMKRSVLQPVTATSGTGAILHDFYRELIAIRKRPAFRSTRREDVETQSDEARRLLLLTRRNGTAHAVIALNFGDATEMHLPPGRWTRVIASSESRWGGSGAELPAAASDGEVIPLDKHSLLVYETEE